VEKEIGELRKEIEALKQINQDLLNHQQAYASAKQSLNRMSARLKKLCKRISSTHECVAEMQEIAEEIRAYAKLATSAANE